MTGKNLSYEEVGNTDAQIYHVQYIRGAERKINIGFEKEKEKQSKMVLV